MQYINWCYQKRQIKEMELASETVFGQHLGEEQTMERNKLYFIRPKIRGDIMKFSKALSEVSDKGESLVIDIVPKERTRLSEE